jgi:hypothetical protein
MGALFIAFDSNFTFEKNEYYFVYQNITFKLLCSDGIHKHLLITIVKDQSIETYKEIYNVAAQFLSAFNWERSYCKFLFKNEVFGVGASLPLDKLGRQFLAQKEMIACIAKVDLPKKIPLINNKQLKEVLGLFREAQIASVNLELYEFFCYWKIFEMIHKTNDPSEKIYDLIGADFFHKKGFSSKKQTTTHLKEKLRNAFSHGCKTKVINPDNYDDVHSITEISRELRSKIWRHIYKNIKIENYLNLFTFKNEYPIYMTEKEYLSVLYKN